MQPELQAFGDEEAADARLVAIQVDAGNDQGFARDDDFAGRSALDGEHHFFLEQSLALRKIERLQAKLLRRGFIKRQAGVIVIHHPPQAGGDGGKQLCKSSVETSALLTSSSRRRRSRSRASSC